jgi:hypothetical protein
MHKSVEEFSVNTLQVAGFCAALQALRLPFSKEARSETYHEFTQWNDRSFTNNVSVDIDDGDMKLISTLVKRGDEHAKVLRGVVVWCEINAPRYWHVELDTYRVGCERLSSESTMHTQGRGLSEDDLVKMKEQLREGTMQKRVWMFSYQTLRRIYFQRRNHRLPQWRKFCSWIETLPFAHEFITIDGNADKD